MYKKFRMLVVLVVCSIFFPARALAHPGNTASDGCHYCRTNCDKWGVPWNVRHCHGGSTTNSGNPSGLTDAEEKKILDKLNSPESDADFKKFVQSLATPTPSPRIVDNTTAKTTETSGDDSLLGWIITGGLGYWGYKWFKSKKK